MNIDLADKVVLITGSSKGIGNALIRALSKEQAKVIINYNNSEKSAYQLYNEVKLNNRNVMIMKADITKQEEVKILCREVDNRFGRIDVLINNAGICKDNYIQMMSEDNWREVMDTNLTGAFLCCRSFQK